MKYDRPKYQQEGFPVEITHSPFSPVPLTVPKFEYPIPVRENFARAARRENPVWVPNSSTDFATTLVANITGAPEMDWGSKVEYDWTDWFGCEWRFVPQVGGSMLKPHGKIVMEDITQWEKQVKFPVLEDWDWEGGVKKFIETHDMSKVVSINIGQGATERLVALMGGYTETMMALALEPEACHDFLMAFAEEEIKFIDKLCSMLPVDMLTYHDDWGTERDTFFGPQMMEDIVFEPSKKIFDHITSKCFMTFHSCGKVERFMPYICDLGPHFVQFQARANDLPKLKREYGDRVGFNCSYAALPSATSEEVVKGVQELIQNFAKGGGLYSSVMGAGAPAWDGTMELFYGSREYYEGK